MIIWLNGTFGAGKTTTSKELEALLPEARIFDAEYVGYMLKGGVTGLPPATDFQEWRPWRQLVVETAARLLEFTGGTLVVPQTVLDERYWTEIRDGLAARDIPVHHFVLHTDRSTLAHRIDTDPDQHPSAWRHRHLDVYEQAAAGWLPRAGTVIDTTDVPPAQVARQVAAAVAG